MHCQVVPDKFAYKDFGAFQMFMFIANIMLFQLWIYPGMQLSYTFKARKIWNITALKCRAFIKTSPVFGSGDPGTAGRPWLALPEEVCKAERARDHFPRDTLYVPILLLRSGRVWWYGPGQTAQWLSSHLVYCQRWHQLSCTDGHSSAHASSSLWAMRRDPGLAGQSLAIRVCSHPASQEQNSWGLRAGQDGHGRVHGRRAVGNWSLTLLQHHWDRGWWPWGTEMGSRTMARVGGDSKGMGRENQVMSVLMNIILKFCFPSFIELILLYIPL